MRTTTRFFSVCVLAGLVLAPGAAHADGFVIPWLGGNVASRDAGGEFFNYGVSVGRTAASVVDVDVDLGYSPHFFGSPYSSYVLTTMGNVTLGLPFGSTHAPRFRPFLIGGLGLIRSRFTDPRFGYSTSNNDFGINVGGGATAFFTPHIGVRADIRHFRSLEDESSASPLYPFSSGPLHFWRTSIGVVIR